MAGNVGATSAEVVLADVNGDGRNDYLVVNDAGRVTAWLNDRYGHPDPWDWKSLIASSSAPRDQVRFADLNGDGRDDYLAVGDQGQVRAWLNTGTGNGVAWTSQGVIASGVGYTRDRVELAEINGDRRADYLVLDAQGGVRAWFNNDAAGGPAPANPSPMPNDPTPTAPPGINGSGPNDGLPLCVANRC
ncbi:FG-GAP repeat domain-containing protein [Micromonospora sp. WMMD730]|uniref:FG-GAP repeat domain-containing protein n=1 Tax=Micromonospora sp. WMMD730 TaxID=3404128 RepID=UPI003B9520F5